MAMTDQPTKGMYLNIDGKYYFVVDRQLKTQGRQGGLIILTLKDLFASTTLNKTIKAGVKVEEIIPEVKEVQYLYADGSHVHFMDTSSYENISIARDVIGEYISFLKDGEVVLVQQYEGRVISIKENPTIELEVTESVDAVKGNTSNQATKVVTLETGYKVQVPLFVKKGDKVIVNTESGTYSGRA
jgi:elongation factor P